MKIIAFLKYILNAASYGIAFAVILLLIVPELRGSLPLGSFLSNTAPHQQALSYAKAVSVAGPAVVNIYSSEIQQKSRFGRNGRNTTRLGSGVIMDDRGYILTNYHVVQNTDLIEVLLQRGQIYPAELIGFDAFTDLAVLKVEAKNLPVIPQIPEQRSLAGDIVLAIGNPLNLGQTVTQGIISATGRNGLSNTSYLEFLQMDAAINDGNSGGALVNTNGELVGINSRKFTNPQSNIQGIFFAVPYQLAYKVMQKIIEHGRVVRGWLGITAHHYFTNLKGFRLQAVELGSPAYQAGLKVGDIVTDIDGTAINSITQALDIIAETPPGNKVMLTVYRQKQQLTLTVIIREKRTPS